MGSIKDWIAAMRLRTLPLSVSGIVIGACFAHYSGRFDGFVFMLAILLTIALQILSNLANDYGDGVKGTDNADRVGPERAVQSGKISRLEMREGIKKCILVVIFLTVSLIYVAFGFKHFFYAILFLVLGGIAAYSALSYTMGDKPYGYRGLGDIYVFIFFGLVSVIGSYFLFAKQLDHFVVLPAICIGLLSVGVLNLNNMRDIESDEKSSKITLAVKMGRAKAKRYHYFLIVGAIMISMLFSVLYFTSLWNLLFFISYIPLAIHLVKIRQANEPKDFDRQLKILALTTFLFALLLGVGYII